MSDPVTNERGAIPLHDSNAIGLQLITSGIGLYPNGVKSKIAGIRVNVDMRHYRAQGSTGGFMNLEFLELTIPGPSGNYIGRIEGWDFYKEDQGHRIYIPQESQLLPDHVDYTTFALLDAWEETDPYFYFGWGQRTDHFPDIGYKRRDVVAYHGVNYPIEDFLRPSWIEVPPEAELYEMLQVGAPVGPWNLRLRISGFTVDGDVSADTHITVRINEGRSVFFEGSLDYVKPDGNAVGENDSDFDGINWGTMINPGRLRMLTGPAAGHVFRVIGVFYTGSNPPAGYPAEMWVIRTHPQDGDPSAMGAKEGDKYRIESPYDTGALVIYAFQNVYPPGVYPEQEFDIDFEMVM